MIDECSTLIRRTNWAIISREIKVSDSNGRILGQKLGITIMAKEREKLVEGDPEHLKTLLKYLMKAEKTKGKGEFEVVFSLNLKQKEKQKHEPDQGKDLDHLGRKKKKEMKHSPPKKVMTEEEEFREAARRVLGRDIGQVLDGTPSLPKSLMTLINRHKVMEEQMAKQNKVRMKHLRINSGSFWDLTRNVPMKPRDLFTDDIIKLRDQTPSLG